MVWFFLNITAAFFWLSWAFGLMSYDPWLVTAAFCLLALNCVLDGIKSLVGV